ncbi:glycerophosphodiester phosphodiesterase [Actinomadura madurae]|uniref:glycerophosphodiester phosphodiesterase n=1 Tax=Actinomadura madurae TaxID=1993 RepID=UPI0020D2556C|nr:glycerophosphodiester phosphodiesterase [Actinomadura madurae]MCP9950594.1 glycerophosphodiester phosphodiesterase [Actinomadura madurae]MCP9967371.1 glycerophosphodiester phosphodiesterase [Actinomadura madurae]MCP9979830.1 glycerophosphodiester phosphodiesterase [Actinomadura madurae]MCQ0008639.1 glycerophosphodiester phosphodiesterase [Actinomadura madurae]
MIFEHAPTVIGHRGYGSGGPTPPGSQTPVAENTLPSLLAAAEALRGAPGGPWVEFDVTRTADDHLVLRHDPTTSEGDHLVDLPATASGLPLLTEIFADLPADVPVDVDVKTVLEDALDEPSRRTGALLLPVLRREARRRRLLVTSFDPSLLMFLKDELPGVPLGLLTWLRFPLWHAVPAAAGLGLDAVAVHTGSCGIEHPDTRLRPLEHCVDVARKAGLETIAWCPSAEAAPTYAAAGFDAMVVNDVPGVLAAV